MRTFEVTVEVRLRITIHDEDVIDRVVLNKDGQGVPQPLPAAGMDKGGTGWQDTLYRLTTAEDVIDMLAYNYVLNHAVAHELDGWADLTVDWRNPYAEYEWVDRSPDIEVRETTAVPS